MVDIDLYVLGDRADLPEPVVDNRGFFGRLFKKAPAQPPWPDLNLTVADTKAVVPASGEISDLYPPPVAHIRVYGEWRGASLYCDPVSIYDPGLLASRQVAVAWNGEIVAISDFGAVMSTVRGTFTLDWKGKPVLYLQVSDDHWSHHRDPGC